MKAGSVLRSRGIKLQAPESGIEIGFGEGFPDAELILEVDNADIIYEQAHRLGCTVVREIADCDWGARMFTIELPKGHVRGWRFFPTGKTGVSRRSRVRSMPPVFALPPS